MASALLVVIDPQNDFTHAAGAYAGRHTGIAGIVEAKTRIARMWNTFDQQRSVLVRSAYRPGQFGALSICLPGTFGHGIDAVLNVDEERIVLTKTEPSCFSSVAFQSHLAMSQTGSLILCGFLAEYCVQETALDALNLGYRVTLVEDCIATGDDVQYRKREVFTRLEQQGATVVQSRKWLERPSNGQALTDRLG